MPPFPRPAERAPDNLDRPRHWSADAECKGDVTNLWYPKQGESTAYAKSICWRCPVRTECLTHALEWPETFGVFGGFDEKERRALIADARRLAAKQREKESSGAAS
ncbi:WhiB family transcriptional regulator [Streptomyces griseus]|uniref:WhiB family transcriptional regulator n=1 Tax=Streptomyces griseus TaxID=1911 RepID=UPI0013025149|nr:WhiB family transcriptional regulator [Streptomyces fimicarius]